MRTIVRRGLTALLFVLVLLIAGTQPAAATEERAAGSPVDPATAQRASNPSLVDLLTRWFSGLWTGAGLPAGPPGPEGPNAVQATSASDPGDESASRADSRSAEDSDGPTAEPQRGSTLDPDG